MRNWSLTESKLAGVDLSHAEITGTRFEAVDLSNAKLPASIALCRLEKCDLSRCDLSDKFLEPVAVDGYPFLDCKVQLTWRFPLPISLFAAFFRQAA